MQMQRLAGYDVNLLGVRSPARFLDLDVITAGTQVHRLVLVSRTGVGAIDEHLGVLHLRVELHLAGVGMRIVIWSPVRSPEWAVESISVIGITRAYKHTHRGRSAHRSQCHQSSG